MLHPAPRRGEDGRLAKSLTPTRIRRRCIVPARSQLSSDALARGEWGAISSALADARGGEKHRRIRKSSTTGAPGAVMECRPANLSAN